MDTKIRPYAVASDAERGRFRPKRLSSLRVFQADLKHEQHAALHNFKGLQREHRDAGAAARQKRPLKSEGSGSEAQARM